MKTKTTPKKTTTKKPATKGRKAVSYKSLFEQQQEQNKLLLERLEALEKGIGKSTSKRLKKRKNPLDETPPENGWADTIVPDAEPFTVNGREYMAFQTALDDSPCKPDPVFRQVVKDPHGDFRARWNGQNAPIKPNRWRTSIDGFNALMECLEGGQYNRLALSYAEGMVREHGEPETDHGQELLASFRDAIDE